MVFGLNILALVKAEILKYKDKTGRPEALDALDAVEKALVIINNFVSKLTPADVEAVLALLPAPVAAKFAPAELTAIATAIANLPTELQEIEAIVTKVETDLE